MWNSHSNFILCNSWAFSGADIVSPFFSLSTNLDTHAVTAYIVSLFFSLSTNLNTHAVTLNSLYNDECLLSSISKRSGLFSYGILPRHKFGFVKDLIAFNFNF